jgi:hypothetical protein
MNVVETYHIFVNSSQRQSGTNGNYTFSLYQPIKLKNQNNSFYVRIGSAELPYTFQLITSANNVITFNKTRGSTTTSVSITIPPGNYNANNILSTITGLLQAVIPETTIIWACAYNKTTGLMTFGFFPSDLITTLLQFTSCSNVMLGCLGFAVLPSSTFGYTGVPLTLTSTQNVNLSQINALYIRSENIKQIQNFESIVVKQDISDILAKVQISVLPGNYIIWINPTDLSVKVNNKYFDMINLYISTNLSYDDVSFNGLNWSCRITIQEIEEVKYTEDKNLIEKSTEPLESKKQELIDELLKLKEQLIK